MMGTRRPWGFILGVMIVMAIVAPKGAGAIMSFVGSTGKAVVCQAPVPTTPTTTTVAPRKKHHSTTTTTAPGGLQLTMP